MKKYFLLFLLLLGCGGSDDDLPILFAKSSPSSLSSSSSSDESSSSLDGSSSSLDGSSSSLDGSSSSTDVSSSSSSPLSSSSNIFGEVTIDGVSYKTVIIDTQTWFQEDLNGEGVGWDTAMEACPEGWHLPTAADWNTLMHFIDGTPPSTLEPTDGEVASLTAASSLLDVYDFGIPGGNGNWWSATAEDEVFAFYLSSLPTDENVIYWRSYPKFSEFSVRCLKN
jgi:hypothetical protein